MYGWWLLHLSYISNNPIRKNGWKPFLHSFIELPSLTFMQVRHLVLVETDVQRATRLATEAAARAPRPPIVVRHAMRQ
jgi:hypothetical protein